MKQLSILFINRWVGYNEGGNETHIKDLLTEFSKRGHTVSIMTTKGTALDKLPEEITRIYIKSPTGYYTYKLFGPLLALSFIIKCFFKYFIEYISGKRYDVLSIHFSLEGFLARWIKLFFGTPYVLLLAGDTKLELIEARRADAAIQISKYMDSHGQKMGVHSVIIPKGVNSAFSPYVQYTDLKKRLNITTQKLILTVARLDPRKDLTTLIEAADYIINKKNIHNLLFIVVGDGIEKEKLKNYITRLKLKKYIKLVGAVPNSSPELPKFYAMSNLFVLPTLYEGFGWVYLEAMASGLPIITTDVGSNPEVVGDVGKLVPPKNPNLLSQVIIEILNDTTKLHNMRNKGLNKAKKYSWNSIGKEYELVYRKTAAKKCDFLCRISIVKNIIIDSFSILNVLITNEAMFNK